MLGNPLGLICTACNRPGIFAGTKDDGMHKIGHTGRGWHCIVPARDPWANRVIDALVDAGRATGALA